MPPRKPKLPPISEAALITPEDVERAKQQWRKDAPPEHRYLLDARLIPDPEDAEPEV